MSSEQERRDASDQSASEVTLEQPIVYQIRLKSHLGSDWTDWFQGLAITLEENGDTLITGPVIDQAALHGLLKKVRDLGISLISVNPVEMNGNQAKNMHQENLV